MMAFLLHLVARAVKSPSFELVWKDIAHASVGKSID